MVYGMAFVAGFWQHGLGPGDSYAIKNDEGNSDDHAKPIAVPAVGMVMSLHCYCPDTQEVPRGAQ